MLETHTEEQSKSDTSESQTDKNANVGKQIALSLKSAWKYVSYVRYAKVLFRSNSLIAVFTFLMLIVTYKQVTTSRTQLRAWVLPEDIRVTSRLETDSPLRVNLTFKNYGPTPALNITALVWLAIGFVPEPPAETPSETHSENTGFVGPGKTMTVNMAFSFNDSLVNQINDGRAKLYLYEYIVYDDVFKNTDSTKSFWEYHPEGVFTLSTKNNHIK